MSMINTECSHPMFKMYSGQKLQKYKKKGDYSRVASCS